MSRWYLWPVAFLLFPVLMLLWLWRGPTSEGGAE